jgi:aryl-alcohol dehydrogenase-like predicted oxidoreductase
MKYRFLGSTGLRVSEIALGTQTFGWGADEPTAHRMADRFYDAGGIFFDTANMYNDGASEKMLGNWLKKRGHRHELVIASKVFFPVGEGVNNYGLTRKNILYAIDNTLKALGTDYVDLYQAHCFDAATPQEETLSAFDDVVRAGKARYIGASNYTPSELLRSLTISERNHWSSFVSLQAEYNLLTRSPDWELLPLCIREGIAYLVWSPLAGGWLTGKYRRDRNFPKNSRAGRRDRYGDLPEVRASDHTFDIVETLIDMSKRLRKTPAQVALNWLLRRSKVIVPVFGSRTVEQLEDNMGCIGWDLTQEDMALLDEVSSLPLPYPYWFIERNGRKREISGASQ